MIGRLLSHYRLIEKIGEGGMGQVYLAEDVRLERRVALKVLWNESPNPVQLARFEREAKAAAALDHPNILAIHDFGTDQGIPYVVMEWLQGRTMRVVLGAGPIKIATALRYAIDVTRAVQAAHSRGINHRDLKPENIFITDDSRVKVLDFGLAQIRRLPTPGNSAATFSLLQTQPGMVMGTAGYMAPEQVLGESDHRADIFSIGAVLFELLSGQRAFRGPTFIDVLHASLNGEPSFDLLAEPTVPALVTRIVRRCMAKRPEERFQSAAELGDALTNALETAITWGSSVRVAARVVPERSIAVLPFRNLSTDEEMEYFSDGVTEDIINALGRIRSLQVAARTSCFAFKGRQTELADVGAKLRVDTVLEGSVRRSGQRLRVTAQLVDIADGFQLWSDRYDRQLDDVFAIQDDIAQNIARSLRIAFGVLHQEPGTRRGTDNLEAYDLFLKGRFQVEQRGDGIARGLELFQQAIARDPNYAMAYAAIAEALTLLAVYGVGRPSEWMPKAKAAATRAIELDTSLADAHNALAMTNLLYDRDWANARAEFDSALDLNPSHVSGHYWKGLLFWLFVHGKSERALAETARAIELDPIATIPAYAHGVVQVCCGQLDAAIATCEHALARDPTSSLLYRTIGIAHCCAGRYDEAIAALQKGATLSARHTWFLSELGAVYAKLGQVGEAERLQSELMARADSTHVSPLGLAVIPAALGRFDEAAAWIDRAYAEREPMIIVLARWPTIKDALTHPRVRQIVEELRLA